MTMQKDIVAINRDHRHRVAKMIQQHGDTWWIERKKNDQLSYESLLSRIPAEIRGYTLELGAASGKAFAFLRELGFAPVVGIDVLPELIQEARKHEEMVTLGRMENIPFRHETFVAVISRHTLEHCEEPEAATEAIYRVTLPGGYSAHIVPAFAGSEAEPAHLTNWDWEQWKQAWTAAGFEVAYWGYQTFSDRELHMLLRRPE